MQIYVGNIFFCMNPLYSSYKNKLQKSINFLSYLKFYFVHGKFNIYYICNPFLPVTKFIY